MALGICPRERYQILNNQKGNNNGTGRCKVGMRVRSTRHIGTHSGEISAGDEGIVRSAGNTVGIEWDKNVGGHSGERWYTCTEGHGFYVGYGDIEPIEEAAAEAPTSTEGFSVGDTVRCTDHALNVPYGTIGKVVNTVEHPIISVEWDSSAFKSGHDCNGYAQSPHGWNVQEHFIEKYEEVTPRTPVEEEPSSDISVGDYVRYDGNNPELIGKIGTVTDIYSLQYINVNYPSFGDWSSSSHSLTKVPKLMHTIQKEPIFTPAPDPKPTYHPVGTYVRLLENYLGWKEGEVLKIIEIDEDDDDETYSLEDAKGVDYWIDDGDSKFRVLTASEISSYEESKAAKEASCLEVDTKVKITQSSHKFRAGEYGVIKEVDRHDDSKTYRIEVQRNGYPLWIDNGQEEFEVVSEEEYRRGTQSPKEDSPNTRSFLEIGTRIKVIYPLAPHFKEGEYGNITQVDEWDPDLTYRIKKDDRQQSWINRGTERFEVVPFDEGKAPEPTIDVKDLPTLHSIHLTGTVSAGTSKPQETKSPIDTALDALEIED